MEYLEKWLYGETSAQAHLNAVRQWKYQPTLLNGEPVAVEMEVNVNFVTGSSAFRTGIPIRPVIRVTLWH